MSTSLQLGLQPCLPHPAPPPAFPPLQRGARREPQHPNKSRCKIWTPCMGGINGKLCCQLRYGQVLSAIPSQLFDFNVVPPHPLPRFQCWIGSCWGPSGVGRKKFDRPTLLPNIEIGSRGRQVFDHWVVRFRVQCCVGVHTPFGRTAGTEMEFPFIPPKDGLMFSTDSIQILSTGLLFHAAKNSPMAGSLGGVG